MYDIYIYMFIYHWYVYVYCQLVNPERLSWNHVFFPMLDQGVAAYAVASELGSSLGRLAWGYATALCIVDCYEISKLQNVDTSIKSLCWS